jgi:ribonuclease D
MTRQELALLPMRKYEGETHVIQSPDELTSAMKDIRSDHVVGLDTESRPAFKKGESYPPCLVQIATASAAYLFQLNRMDFASAIREVMESPLIVKAGIGFADDLSGLQGVFPFEPANILDLSLVAQKQGINRSGVRNLAGQLLGFRISKGAATSNWTSPELTQRQIDYAATDAWVCRELFTCFQELEFLDERGRPLPVQKGASSEPNEK